MSVVAGLADLATWEAHLVSVEGMRPRGADAYARSLRALFAQVGSVITLDSIQAFLAANPHWKDQTRSKHLSAIRRYVRGQIAAGLRADDPTLLISWPKLDEGNPNPLSKRELRKLQAALQCPEPNEDPAIFARNKRAILTMLYAGARISECAALLWCDVDLDDDQLHIRREVGKGGKARRLPLHRVLVTCYEETAEEARVGALCPVIRGAQPGEDPRPMRPKSLAHIFEQWLPARGVRGIHAHRLRHTFATELLMRGANLLHIKELMGHRSLETTQRYLKVCPTRLRGDVGLLPDRW